VPSPFPHFITVSFTTRHVRDTRCSHPFSAANSSTQIYRGSIRDWLHRVPDFSLCASHTLNPETELVIDREQQKKFQPSGEMIPNAFIEYSASKKNISLRTGCMCNPGGAAAMLGVRDDVCKLSLGMLPKDFETIVGRELGVTRISLGIASSFWDVWKVVEFAAAMGDQKSRQALWDNWMDGSGIGYAI